MKVILLQDIKNVGRKEQVIEANDGYARNYLFPKKLAIEASKDNMLKLQAKKTAEANKKKAEIEANKEIAKKIEKIELQIKAKSGENGKIFGGVSAKEIAQELENVYQIKVDKKKIDLKETIKTLGVHNVDIKLFEGVVGKVRIDVISE